MDKIHYIWLLFILFISCKDTNRIEEITPTPDRTILVYMGGKSNLSTETYEKLYALKEGYDGKINGKLIIYHAPLDASPRLLEICSENGENIIKTIEQYQQENSADPTVLAKVIQKTKDSYPAHSYGLIVFSHASGWLPANTVTYAETRAIIADNQREMELKDFANAIPDNLFDFIIFEACYMAGIEVAYELKSKADYIFASSAEILSPGFTDLYKDDISYLYKINPNLYLFLGNAFDYFSSKTGERSSATFSLIQTSSLKNLAKFLNHHVIWNKEVPIEEIQYFDRYATNHLFYDFGDYFNRKLEGRDKQQLLSNIINECVLHKSATPTFMPYTNGFDINKHSGLTTYIFQDEREELNQKYKELDWYKDVYESEE